MKILILQADIFQDMKQVALGEKNGPQVLLVQQRL